VPVGNIGRDGRHGQHGRCGGEADGAVDAARHGQVPVIAGQRVVVGAARAAGCSSGSPLRDDRTYRTEIGLGETGPDMGSSSMTGLGGIWEAASGANLPEPVPTELKQSL